MRIPLLLTTALMSMAPIGLTQDAPQPQNIFAVKCTDIRTQLVQGTGRAIACWLRYFGLIFA